MKTITIIKMNAPTQSRARRFLGLPILAFSVAILFSGIATSKTLAAASGVTATAGSGADASIFDIGNTGQTNANVKSGSIEIDFTPNQKPDSLTIYYPPRAKGGKQIYSTGGPVVDSTVQNPIIAAFSGTSTLFEIVINEGLPGDPANVWSYVGVGKDSTGKKTIDIKINQTTPAPTPAVTPPPTPAPRTPTSSTSTRGYYRVNLRTLLRTLTQ